jgi:hypothetical protein
MPSSATQKKAHADAIPSIVGNWNLEVSNDPNLGMLDSIEITAQVRNLIFGSVKSDQPVTAYALENGALSNGTMSFQLSIEGVPYQFEGQFDGTTISGSVNKPNKTGNEEGSWSAQAQGGPGEEEKKHPRKHTKRSAR